MLHFVYIRVVDVVVVLAGGSWRLCCQVGGVPIDLHFSFLILVGITVTWIYSYFDDTFEALTTFSKVIFVSLAFIAFALSIFLHELGHMCAFRLFHVPVTRMLLCACGGVTEADQEVKEKRYSYVTLNQPYAQRLG